MNYTVTRNANGSYTLAAIRDNRRVWRTYYGYTERQAEQAFVRWLLAAFGG